MNAIISRDSGGPMSVCNRFLLQGTAGSYFYSTNIISGSALSYMNYSLHVIQANIWPPLVKPPWRCHLLPKAGNCCCEEEKQKALSFHLRSFLWIFHQWMHYRASLINWFGQFWGQTPPQNCTWYFPTAAKKNFYLKWVILKTFVCPGSTKCF